MYLYCAETGAQQSGKNAQQRRFPRSIFADQDVATAGFKVNGYLPQGRERSKKPGDAF